MLCYKIKKFRLNNTILDGLDHLTNSLFKMFAYPRYCKWTENLLVM